MYIGYNHSNEDNQEQVAAEENYLGNSQYEQERFTDEYSEYF
jgi:hypothetical protein